MTADEVASPAAVRGRPEKASGAAALIQELLEDGPMDSKELERRVRAELGIGEKTFRTAGMLPVCEP